MGLRRCWKPGGGEWLCGEGGVWQGKKPAVIRTLDSGQWLHQPEVYENFFYYFADNRAGMKEDAQLFSMMAILSGTYSVDTFFFLRYPALSGDA